MTQSNLCHAKAHCPTAVSDLTVEAFGDFIKVLAPSYASAPKKVSDTPILKSPPAFGYRKAEQLYAVCEVAMSKDSQRKSQQLITIVASVVMAGLCLFGLLFIVFSEDQGIAAAEVWSYFRMMALAVVSYLFGSSDRMER